MKSMKPTAVVALLGALLAIAAAAPEPPRRFARVQEEPPYPPSGWRPDKPFYLPGEEPTTTVAPATSTTEEPTTTTVAPPEDAAEGDNDGAEGRDVDDENEQEPEPAPANIPAGVYYVLLPDGRLQRVNYQQGAANYVIQELVPYSAPLTFAPYVQAPASPYVQAPAFYQILKK
ncbi:uncharacterized protein LOC124160277 [Ischnura elegans]|uniref:uncharacterized protein LOC124160277 n=1 Tax=Ischnura elegans TaxID=197161 RepID=UPI001ED88D81|nr:uncharacterized protein LOC124160277 [Ischnura elegans]